MSFKYKVELLIEVPDDICGEWDSSCDETFGIADYLDSPRKPLGNDILDYKEISNEEYAILEKQKIFKWRI